MHTHDAFLNEISNCQIFILIIGGRSGDKYIHEKDKSITNAEYQAAVSLKIPIFSFIKKEVLENYKFYQENKDKPFTNEINFPAIAKQEDAISIFNFIYQVKSASVNNGYESFENSKDIESIFIRALTV